MDTRVRFAPGSEAWVAGERDTWSLATVVNRSGKVVKLKPKDGGKSFKMNLKHEADKVFPANSAIVSDMTSLQFFHVPGILHNLRERSLADEPYTFLSGSVLVAVNPLRRVEDPEGILGKPSAVNVAHPYAIAESAFQQLVFGAKRAENSETPINQSIIVGGESGAGKTESSKYVLKHLVSRDFDSGRKDEDLDQRLIESNPILEAFGNAATKRNHNSSRFGKFMKLHFTLPKKKKPMRIYGASVNTYLLERSRVTFHVPGERTYHVFYQLVHGANKKLRKRLKLDDQEFEYLKPRSAPGGGPGKLNLGSNAVARKGGKASAMENLPDPAEDKANFKELCTALATVGVSVDADDDAGEDDGGLFEVVSAILHLGNIVFTDKDSSEGPVANVKDEAPLETAAKLLKIKPAKLLKVFVEHKVKAVGEELVKKRDSRGAKYALDAVAKFLYVKLFDWVVGKITTSLSEKGSLEDLPYIGVLDIFGFETFKTNDFEQLLINFTNEALQSCFNQQIFQAEAELYEREGLLLEEGERQPPPDNIECVMLLQGGAVGSMAKEKKKKKKKSEFGANAAPGGASGGILGMIDAEGRNPQANDTKLNAALHRAFKNNEYFPLPHPKDARLCFIVRHYAGDVKYTTGSFLEKNTDNLPLEVHSAMKNSKLGVVQAIFESIPAPSEDEGRGKKKRTAQQSVAGKFRDQMESLVDELNATRCAFIRCIKPNASMTRRDNSWFDPLYVMPQLINLSIPQTAEVLRGGLPTRIEFSIFTEMYSSKLPKDALNVWKSLGQSDEKLFVRALFFAFEIPADTYKMGLTRVFFKSGMLEKVNEVLGGAMSEKRLDGEIADRFRRSFVIAMWRRFFATLVATHQFVKLLELIRERGSAATVIQRLARRKMLELEAKALLSELRAERDARLAKEEELRAKEAKKRAKEAKRLKEEAQNEEERRRLELEESVAATQAGEHDRRAKHLSMSHLQAKRHERELRRSVRLIAGGKLNEGLQVAQDSRRSYRMSMRRSYAFQRRGSNADDDDDEEEETPLVFYEGVQFHIVREQDNMYLSAPLARYAGQYGQRGQREHSRSGGLGAFACLNFFRRRQRRQLSEVVREQQGVESARARSASAGSNAHDANDESKRDGLDWDDCMVQLNGYQLRYFRDVDLSGEVPKGKGAPIGVLQVGDGFFLERPEAPQDALIFDGEAECTILQGPYRLPLIKFRFEDAYDCQEFCNGLESAKRRYDYEISEAEKFESGELTPAVIEYRQMLENGLITKAQFEMAIMQQVSTEDEYIDDLVGAYGEDAYVDYKMQCPECREVLFNLPDAPLDQCPECGSEDLDTPATLETEARIARMQIVAQREQRFVDGGGDSPRREFPFHMTISGVKYEFSKPEKHLEMDAEQVRSTFKFEMEWTRKEEGEDWCTYYCVTDWDEAQEFFTNILPKSEDLSHETRRSIPDFPDDVQDATGLEDMADKRLALFSTYVVSILRVAQMLKLFDNSTEFCAFLGMHD